MTDQTTEAAAGVIFYDAQCGFCSAARRRWGPVFERRGFAWLPLQTPGTAERLRVSPDQLMAQMWVVRSQGPAIGGADAWAFLFSRVWWLKPVAVLMVLPGLKAVAHATYRWIATHRHCVSGNCRLP